MAKVIVAEEYYIYPECPYSTINENAPEGVGCRLCNDRNLHYCSNCNPRDKRKIKYCSFYGEQV